MDEDSPEARRKGKRVHSVRPAALYALLRLRPACSCLTRLLPLPTCSTTASQPGGPTSGKGSEPKHVACAPQPIPYNSQPTASQQSSDDSQKSTLFDPRMVKPAAAPSDAQAAARPAQYPDVDQTFSVITPLRQRCASEVKPKIDPSTATASKTDTVGLLTSLMGGLCTGKDTEQAILSSLATFDNGAVQKRVMERAQDDDEEDRKFVEEQKRPTISIKHCPAASPAAQTAEGDSPQSRPGLSAPSSLPADEHSNSNFDVGHLVELAIEAASRERRYFRLGYLKHERPRRAITAECNSGKFHLLAAIEKECPNIMYDLLRALRGLDLLQQGCAMKRLDGTAFCPEGLRRINEIKLDLLLQAHLSIPMCVAGEE